jgi:hypothetical protein
MNLKVYLPDAIGEQAKAAGLNLSRLLRDAVSDELERRTAMSETLTKQQVHEVEIVEDEGSYTGRITGTRIGNYVVRGGKGLLAVYVTDDERVIVYDTERCKYWQVDDPQQELSDELAPADYADAMKVLGLKAIIDL